MANENKIATNDFSNDESKRLYADGWTDEPICRGNYERGNQCGGCSFFAPLNYDYGICCHNKSRHFTETVFEHFTCPAHVPEGWGPHSFSDDSSFHCRCQGEPVELRDAIFIRPERASDAGQIRAVTEAAFSACPYGHHGEATLIERLRSACPEIISLVSERGGQVVAHALLSPAAIAWGDSDSDDVGLGLGPVAVLPDLQRRGIGSLLIKHGLEMARDRGASFVCVLGEPAFYGRLGFQPAARFGVFSDFGGATDGAFQVTWLNVAPKNTRRGEARYRPEFSQFRE